MNYSVAELAHIVGGLVDGEGDVVVTGAASVDEASRGDIVLAENARYLRKAAECEAACVVTGHDTGPCPGKSLIRSADPAAAYLTILQCFERPWAKPSPGIAPGAVVEDGVRLGAGVSIGVNCYVGSGADIGNRCILFPNVYVGERSTIGDDSIIYPGVTIYRDCRVGARVTLHAGVVIGSDGFGYRPGGTGLVKYPHIGTVEIRDDVEIGANSAVDRAKTGATIIGRGTKIDNLVHIAHNVKIGANCVIVALSGVAGSVDIGDGVTLAAQTGVKDHVRIGDGCTVAARAGVIGDLPGGKVVSGFPARDHLLEKRVEAARLHLPDILQRLRALEREVERLGAGSENSSDDDTDD